MKPEEYPRTRDAATETSFIDILASTSNFTTFSDDSREILTDIRGSRRPEVRNVATETDFPTVTSLTISITTTDIDVDYSSDIVAEERAITRKDSLLHYAASSSASSTDEDNEVTSPQFTLKSSKSQHVRKAFSSSDEDVGRSLGNSNLEKGNAFVYMVIPPDGGYGWFIMFISFWCQVVVDGIIFGVGVILPHIAEEFQIPGSKVILVASMQVGFYFLAGTVSSAFINKYGFRPVALAGCLLSIAVLTLATFTTNLSMMILFYSILGGPGLSMVWVSSQLIIGYYFEKYRPIANGISCSGAGAGIMMFAYMNNVLITQLGWRNLMRLHVAFLLLVFLMGLTFVEVAPTKIGRVKEMSWEDSETDSHDILTEMTKYSRYSLRTQTDIYELDKDFEDVLKKIETPIVQPPISQSCCSKCRHHCCPCFQNYLLRKQEAKAQEAMTKHYIIRQDPMEKQDLFYMGPRSERHDARPSHGRRKTVTFGESDMRTISLDDIDQNINSERVVDTLSHMAIHKQMSDQRKSYKELKEIKKCPLLEFLKPGNLLHPKIRNGFRLLFDFRLLELLEFRILLASAFLFPMGFNIPFVYSTVRVQIEPSFAKLISPSIGFSNFAFRIASGFVAYKYRDYTTFICGGGMVFGGIAVCASAFYGLDVVWFQFLYAICYGIAPAFYSTLRAIIYVRSLGLDKLTNAFGLTALAMGMGVFIGTTAGGILNDLTGDYTASFAFAGICIIVAGALKLLLPYLMARVNVNQK
ncbi:tarag [Musca autumnalis]|uniref:tarag n=1 Tax=Musca autumnalis TaxID=221902 RepID=UPI003CF7F5D2